MKGVGLTVRRRPRDTRSSTRQLRRLTGLTCWLLRSAGVSHPLLGQRKRAGARGHLHLFKLLADFYLARTRAGRKPPSRAELQLAGQALHAAQCRCGKVGWKPCKDWLTAWRAWLVAESPLPPGDDQHEAQVRARQLDAYRAARN